MGLVSWLHSQAAIALRSYVKESAAMTGSSVTSCVCTTWRPLVSTDVIQHLFGPCLTTVQAIRQQAATANR
jgi:hypothetical protein